MKPNIILILCDQMRGDCLGADGNATIESPYLDMLAARGARFKYAYSVVPSCLPARACLITGQNQWHTGLLGVGKGQPPIPNNYPHTLAGELSKGGYRTHMVGKGHFNPSRASMGFQSMELHESGRTLRSGYKDEYHKFFDRHAPAGITPFDHGIDMNSWMARPWHTEEYLHPTAWTVRQSLQFLEQRDKAQPFFLNISFHRPHSPYVPPQAFWDLYDEDLPEAAVGDWASIHDVPAVAVNVNAWRGKKRRKQIQRARRGYYGEISFVDNQLGVLLNWMRRFDPQAARNTYFIFTSDHGDMLGDHNLWRKTYAYEGSTRIPLFVVLPQCYNGPKGVVADEVVELRDIMPTILEAVGLPIPPSVDGKSLLPLVWQEKTEWRHYLHGEHIQCYHPDQQMQFVTNGKKKFIWLPNRGEEQFFDLEVDPQECHNLIDTAARQEEIGLWRERLIQELTARNCGGVKDGELHWKRGTILVSPYRNRRWMGKE